MGVIQGSINNLLGLSVVAARLSPGLEQKRELNTLKKQEKAMAKVAETQEEATGPEANSTEANELYSQTLAKKADIATKIFETQPTEQTYQNVIAERQGQAEFKDIIEQAETKLLQEQERTRKSQQFRQTFTEGGRYK